MKGSQFNRKTLDILQDIIFRILLVTDGRTTDILETLLGEKLKVQVIRQEQIGVKEAVMTGESQGAPYYIRESVLIGEKSGVIVSYNIALVYSKNVPPALFESMANRQEGIGKVMNSQGIRTLREVIDFGFIEETATVDLFNRPVNINLPSNGEKFPYKKYFIYFGRKPGIQMVEYFNPAIIQHRLKQEVAYEQPHELDE
ncbi:DUF98 domain-containing protein [Gracilibacillus oryzae]|uniref:DUF98 domain-containing protein n=1 Tax=Gracilibacillus oryzae TaxID=1672701 RepID=A0A7C8KZF6_9BACI|nr:chorismate pyruvate-lyase family protein [Gracilibacillus oryzae]KAB8136764.1 DUF98 domain-containing protein [Gracilibacillus oryzae]